MTQDGINKQRAKNGITSTLKLSFGYITMRIINGTETRHPIQEQIYRKHLTLVGKLLMQAPSSRVGGSMIRPAGKYAIYTCHEL